MTWPAVLVACVGCYALKSAGAFVPRRWIERPSVQAVARLVPIALLIGLVVVNTIGTGRRYGPDARLAGMAVAVVAITRRVPFLLVVILASATTALVRHLA